MTKSKSIRKWIILFILAVFLLISYNYIYQDHRDIKTESPDFIVSSASITNEFSENLITSEKKYLNKTVEVSGITSELNLNDLTLDDHVFCSFNNQIKTSLKIHSEIKIKGRFIGYDDLLEQIKLDQCYIID